jgi:hypothetical protein
MARHLVAGVVLGEPGFAEAKEEGGTALGLDGEKVFSPCGVSSGCLRNDARTVRWYFARYSLDLAGTSCAVALLASRSDCISRIGGFPKNRRYSRLNWLALS